MQVAIGWLVLDLTDSAFWVGLSGFAGGLPMLLLALPAGAAADRFDRRRVLVVCQAALCGLGVILAGGASTGVVTPLILLAAAALNGALMTVNNTVRQTMVPATVDRRNLQSAIALLSAGQNSSRIIGPSLAGACIAVGGAGAAFVLQAVFVTFALIATLLLAPMPTQPRAGTQPDRVLDGLRIVRARRLLRDLILLVAIPTLIVFPYMQLLPLYARDILDTGPQGLGLFLTSSGIGTVLGALLVARATDLHHPGRFMVATTVVYCLVVLLFGLSDWVWLSLPLLVAAGVTGAVFLSLNTTLLQLNVGDDVRGRVIGVSMVTWGLMPLGALPMGIVAARFGAQAAVAGSAAIAAGLTLLLALRSPELWRL